ncbi:LacI family DNA-binding transcriptional regulator [Candidatus Galacturonibacter soehngenii]|uniref:LacI family transcriptional regulator n=1 Tax=Candidatus Galacturonatibacter soehngenii TaxID=2307010 RepID=A0A7V7QHV7_9FIRM|nr:LacI family DNA-binding transcriptional regulator [Candidatus Galacturonibacter soehngenii]KAB1434528.1 LacI family transcriptional regulator [Candidatus Galacturonibacter soehngenii]
MRIKSKDIAKELNLSPATVSLVLNGRPGVNEKTRKKVLDYMENVAMKEYRTHHNGVKEGMVVMINYMKHGIVLKRGKGSTILPIHMQMEEAVRKAGYEFKIIDYWEEKTEIETLIEELTIQKVKGIYILAAEMHQADIYPFLKLKIPIVVGDNLFNEQGIDSFLVDNEEGIARGVNYLVEKGHSNIVYLAENLNIFNFMERREAFIREMAKRGVNTSKRIRNLGNNVDEVYESMKKYLDEGVKKTSAFILESSVVSLGVSRAILERQIKIPKDISLIGFDALPPISLLKIELTLVKGTHTRRHLAAIKHLLRRIEDNETEIVRTYYKTRLLEGNSVFDKTKYIYHA